MDNYLFIGRFQPFHFGHLELCKYAAARCSKLVIGLGSCNAAPSKKNPFSVSQREEMIRSSCGLVGVHPEIIHLHDYFESDEKWAEQVRQKMSQFGEWTLFGHSKDSSSFYLRLFPERAFVPYKGPVLEIDATAVRSLFFDYHPDFEKIKQLVPSGTFEVLKDHYKTERWEIAARNGTYL